MDFLQYTFGAILIVMEQNSTESARVRGLARVIRYTPATNNGSQSVEGPLSLAFNLSIYSQNRSGEEKHFLSSYFSYPGNKINLKI